MGLFDTILSPLKSLTGVLGESKQIKDSTGTSQQDIVGTSQKDATQKQTSSSLRIGETSQDTRQITSTLDENTLATLQGLIQQIAAAGGSGLDAGLAGSVGEPLDFARFLSNRAVQTGDVVSDNVAAIVSDARRTGERELTRQGTVLSEAAGSGLNTVNAAVQGRGRADLEAQLASIAAELNIRGRELESSDLATAFAALTEGLQTGSNVDLAGKSQPVQLITQLVDALKGGVTETVSQATGTSTESTVAEALSTLIEALTSNQSTTGATTSKVVGTDTGSILDVVGQGLDILDPPSSGRKGGGGGLAGLASLFAN